MCRKAFSFGGMLLLVGAEILVAPGFTQAQHGGGHGSGSHGGGASFGGGHSGNAHFGGDRFRGYRGGFYRDRSRYGGYGYGSYPYNDDAYDSGYTTFYGDGAQDYLSGATSAAPLADHSQVLFPLADATAHMDAITHITVSAPADAQIWFDGARTNSTGPVREFQSPPLTPGQQYSYEVRARWNENGREVTQTQHVQFTAGAHFEVEFRGENKTAEKISPAQKR